LVVPFDILAELLPVHHRGRDLIFIEYFWTLGTLVVPLVAFLTLGNEPTENHDNQNGWRYFVLICAIPCSISAIIGFCLVPESPRWLLTVGKEDKAMAILRRGAVANNIDPNVAFPEGTCLKPEKPEASSLKDLFTPAWRWITIRLWITWAGFAFLYYGTILATTFIFQILPMILNRVMHIHLTMGPSSYRDLPKSWNYICHNCH
jgi:putative MFS transporter